MKIYLEKISNFIKENPAYSISIANVFLILLLFITKDPLDLRANTYEKAKPFFSNSINITKVEIEKTKLQNSKLSFTKKNDSWSFVYQGKEIPAETEKIDSLIKGFKEAKKFTVVSSSKDKSDEFGFNEDEMKVELFSDNNSIGFFLLGAAGKNGSSIHVKWNNDSEIYLVEENLKNQTGRGDANHFFNKKISPVNLNNEEVLSIQLNSAKNNYKLVKSNLWNLESPTKGEIANDDVQTTLTKLTSMSADDIVLDDTTLKGLEPNPFTIVVNYKDKENIPKSFTILSACLDKKLNTYYIRKNNEPTVYKMTEYSIKSILEWEPSKLVKK